MRLYLAPDASFELTRYLRSTNSEEGLGGTPVRKRMLNDAVNSSRGIDELDETAQRWLSHVGMPVHAYVADRAKGTRTKRLVTHVFGQSVPYGAFLDLGHGVCVCTPQFSFLQIAAKCDLVETVCLGMELCGTYSRWSLDSDGAYGTQHMAFGQGRGCAFDLPPALRANRIPAFVKRLSAFRGSKRAQSAAKWVVDNSASPMETAVYLLLCLPKRLGGYGLPKPVLNPKLTINNPDGVKVRYPDMFWSGANVDVEYNSDAEHSGEWARYRDSKREVELTVANVKVLPLTRAQLMNTEEFDAFAQGLRRLLGVQARGYDLRWAFKRDELRRRLLEG